MKIGIDTQTTLGQKTGFGFYVENLVKNLKKIDPKNQYILFTPNTEKDFSAPQRFIWDQIVVPKRALLSGIDILHQPCFSAPLFYPGRIVVTVHDLIAVFYGQDIPLGSRLYFGRWMPFSYRHTDKIIADSEHTKKDIIKILKAPEEKIRVIYLAVDTSYHPIKDQELIAAVNRKYHTGQKYLLHIGTLNPRKNLEFLIRVFADVVKDYPECNLVITGKRGWYYEGLFNLIKKLGLSQKVIFPGYVNEEDKPALYSGASIFVFPSLYEGFGLPPLEAMACGTPVVASNTSSMPEVIGKAGILLSPNDKKSWVRSISEILSRPDLMQKMRLASASQAQKFSWRQTAQQTLEVYNEVFRL